MTGQGASRPKKTFRLTALVYDIHSWTGVVLGWLLFVCCVSGTLVVYKMPLKAWANPAIVSAPAADPLGPDKALALIRAHDPKVRPGLFTFPADDYSIHQYTLEAKGQGKTFRYWLNPATGEIHKGLQSDFADFVLRLHANLFLGKYGRWLIGFLGILMTVSLITGLWFYWNKIGRDAFRLRLGSHSRQAWSDLHKAIGLWALPFHLAIAITGGWLGIETLVRQPSPPPLAIKGVAAPAPPTSISATLEAAQERLPGLSPTHVNYAAYGKEGSSVRVQGKVPGLRFVQEGQSMVVMDAATLAPIRTVDPTKMGLAKRLMLMARPIHYGYFGGGLTEALYFLLGAGLCALTLSGLIVWTDRDKRKRLGPGSAPKATVMERMNLGVSGGLLISLAGVAVLTALGRAPQFAGAFSGLGDLRYMASQDVFSGKPLAPEMGLFTGLWLMAAIALAALGPKTGWRAALVILSALLIALPCASALAGGGLRADFARGAGESAGLAFICALLIASSALMLRRLSRPSLSRKINKDPR